MVDVLRAAFSGKYGTTFQELREFFTFHCGLAAYTGTNDGREVSRRIKEGDKEAELAYRGMAYQVAKEIGAAGAVPFIGSVVIRPSEAMLTNNSGEKESVQPGCCLWSGRCASAA